MNDQDRDRSEILIPFMILAMTIIILLAKWIGRIRSWLR